jgi:NitT/TauT family transport system substrate-binding protein
MKATRALAVVTAALLACCSRPVETPKQTVGAARVTLNMNPSMTYAPMMIALDEGFFTAEGIDAVPVSLDSNSALAALVGGKLDVLSSGVRSGVFNTILQGRPLRVVADRGHSTATPCTSEAFVAPVAMAKRIAEAGGSLRGQRVAVVRGGVLEYLIARLLETRHTEPADVLMVQLPQGTPVTSRDELDAVRYTSEPNLSILLRDGSVAVVSTTEEVAPGHQNTVLVYGNRLLSSDRDLGQRFMRAYLRGVRRYNEGKTGRNVNILSRRMKVDAKLIRESCWPAIASDGRIDPGSVQPFLDWSLANRYLDRPITTASWWDPSFIDAAGHDAPAPAQ